MAVNKRPRLGKITEEQLLTTPGLKIGDYATKVDRRFSVKTAQEWSQTGQWVRMRSSNVAAIRYDKQNTRLWIQFKSGSSYRFEGVPVDTAMAMFNANSPGRFVWLLRRSGYLGIRGFPTP